MDSEARGPGAQPGDAQEAAAGEAVISLRGRNVRTAIAHELRTPLTVMLGFADLLLDGAAGPLNAGQRDAVAAIREAALKELAVVEEVEAMLRSGELAARLRGRPSPSRPSRSPAG